MLTTKKIVPLLYFRPVCVPRPVRLSGLDRLTESQIYGFMKSNNSAVSEQLDSVDPNEVSRETNNKIANLSQGYHIVTAGYRVETEKNSKSSPAVPIVDNSKKSKK